MRMLAKNFDKFIFVLLLATSSIAQWERSGRNGEGHERMHRGHRAGHVNADGDAVAFLLVVNQHEIDVANLVYDKLTNADVKAYADTMKTDHGKNKTDTETLAKNNNIAALENRGLNELKAHAKKDEDKLKALTTGVDKAYMESMVKGHEMVLRRITHFLAEVQNAALKTHLASTKDVVTQHLNKAKDIVKGL